MIIMKTKDNTFPDIWEKDGTAPFSSQFIGTDILNCKLPLRAVGVYFGSQDTKNISLLSITNTYHNTGQKYDIQIVFRFIKKIEINSHDFDQEISKINKRLFFILDEEVFSGILKKFGYVYKPEISKGVKSTENESVLPDTPDKTRILSDYFHGTGNWSEFEKKAANLFHILGFQVLIEGHQSPKKRVADFYCYSPPSIKDNRICIIVDCKNQDEYFINAADERAMREYIEDKKAIIAQEGISSKNIFFLFIARSFSNEARVKVLEISKQTQSYGALITYKNLIFLTEKKLRTGYRFYLEQFHKFFKNDEILPSNINYTYSTESEGLI